MSRSRYRIHNDEMPYFHTCTILEWLPVFTRPPAAQIILDALRFMQEQRGQMLYAYVIIRRVQLSVTICYYSVFNQDRRSKPCL